MNFLFFVFFSTQSFFTQENLPGLEKIMLALWLKDDVLVRFIIAFSINLLFAFIFNCK